MLTVPVGIYPTNANTLVVVEGGEYREVPITVPPFTYSVVHDDEEGYGNEVNLIGIGKRRIIRENLGFIPVRTDKNLRAEIPTIDYVFDLVKEHPEEIHRLSSATPEHPIVPKAAFLDIETDSTHGHFSRPDRDEILSVQLGFSTSDREYLLLQDSQTNERQILEELMRLFAEEKPDIIVGYSIIRFDGPFIRERLKRNGMLPLLTALDRTKNTVLLPGWMRSSREDEETYLANGLFYLDLYLHAKADLALKELPSRSLKNVARKYGAQDVKDLEISEKKHMRDLLDHNRDRFVEYALSDLRQTRYLYPIYMLRLQAAANLLECPLVQMHRMSSGQKSYIAVYREAKRHGWFSLSSNYNRYRDLYELAPKYQGAIVECFRQGYFPHTKYADAKCLRGDSLVQTDDGYKEIRSIKTGDRIKSDAGTVVVTMTGTSTHTRILKVTTVSGNSIECSREHRFPVYRQSHSRGFHPDDTVVNVMAKDLKEGDWLLECYHYDIPRDEIEASKEALTKAELLGLFDAEGYIQESIRDRIRYDRNESIQKGIRYTQVSFTIHQDETKIAEFIRTSMERFTGCPPNVQQKGESKGITLQYGAHTVYEFMSDLEEKRGCILSSVDLCRAYLRGLYSGDGTYNKTRREISLTQSTGNNDIIEFAHLCLTRCGIPHTLTDPMDATIGETHYSKRMIEISSSYVNEFMETIGFIENKHVPPVKPRKPTRPSRVRSGYQISKIRSIVETNVEEETLYDISVSSTEHPYFFANDILTHNSMYPNIMHDFNVSYDRYIVENILPFKNAEEVGINTESITADGPAEEKRIYVPDENYRMVFVFKIDLVHDGFIRQLITKYNRVRDDYKRRMKELKKELANASDGEARIKLNEQILMYDSMQNEAKIINNTIYGIQGNRAYEVADLPAAIFVTAMGRWIITTIMERLGDALIEVDTDGVLFDADKYSESIEDLNRHVRQRILDTFGVPEEKLKFLLEFEGEGSVYMYSKKNYVLRKDDDPTKLTIKGSAFTSYDKAPVVTRAVKIMADAIMHGKDYDEAYRDALEIEKLPLEYFMFSKTLKKDPTEYKGSSEIDLAVKGLNDDGKWRSFREMKKLAMEWVNLNYKNIGQKDRLVNLLRSCKTEAELDTVLAHVREVGGVKAGSYFVVDLIWRLMERGRMVEPDDIVEFYYTRTAEQYTISEDLESREDLDYARYRKDILNILERFEYASPTITTFNVW